MTDQVDVRGLTVAVLGGTGDLGQGLVYRLAGAGVRMLLGSRDAQRAADAAAALCELVTSGAIEGMANDEASRRADLVIVAVPWAGHAATLRELAGALAGKIVVDCVNPLGFDSHGPYRLDVPEGSAVQQAAALLPESRVVAAFHNVSASMLMDSHVDDLAQDVLVLGDDRGATDIVRGLADLLPGVRGVYGGRLRNAGQVEALTANLIAINRRYKTRSGIKITGL